MPTMTDTATKQTMTECRACLSEIQDDSACTNLFQAWDLPWSGMGVSIAEDLAKLANIQISISDTYSQVICLNCCSKLRNAISFIVNVQNSDMVLKRDYSRMPWPKPIQVDKTMAGNTISDVDVEIKQEVVTDDDFDMNESFNEPIEPRLDIKIEPEEITPASPSIVVEINGPISLHPETSNTNGPEYSDENLLQTVKEEPTSDDENEGNSGVPKDCMLCMKTFNTVKGLKAHVIAIHSYDTVFTPNVSRSNVCTSCNRSFATRTDLFVHETCHNKFTCYVCDEKFDTFVQLTKHRSKQCMKTTVLPRLKTLNDVRRMIPVYYIMDKMNAESSQTDDPRPTTPENAASEPTEHINRPNSTSVNKKTNHEQFKKEKQLQDFSENISREVNTNSSAEVSAEWIVKKDKIQIHESTKKSANNMTDSRVEINSKKVTENIQEQSKSVNDLLLSKNNAEEKYKSSYAIKETNLSQEPNKCAITDTLFSEGIKIKEEIIDQVFTPIDILVTTVETISNNETKENGSESFKSVLNKIQSVENKFNVTDEKKRRFQDSNKTRKKRVKISKSENNSKNTDKIISDVQETEESNKQARTPFDHKQDNDIFKSEDDETKDIPLQILKTDIDEETSCEQMDANEENQIEHRTPLPKSLLGKIEDNSGSESMEIQLEIHSMDKEHDNAIIEDNDFESDFVMKRSKND